MAVTQVGTPAAAAVASGSNSMSVTGAFGTGQNATQGNLLVALVTAFGATTSTVPSTATSGWVSSGISAQSGGVSVVVYTLARGAGAATAPVFTSTGTGTASHARITCEIVELHDPQGTPALATSGTNTGTTTSLTVTTSGNVPAVSYALALFCQGGGTSGTGTYTKGTSWTAITNTFGTSTFAHSAFDQFSAPPSGSTLAEAVSWTATTANAAGIVVVFKPPSMAAALSGTGSLTAPAAVNFASAAALSGSGSLTASVVFGPWIVLQENSHAVSSGNGSCSYLANVSSGTKLIAWLSISASTGGTDPVSAVKDGALNAWTKLVSFQFSSGAGWLECWALDTPAGDVGAAPTLTATVAANFGVSMIIQEVQGLLSGNTSAMIDGSGALGSANSSGPAVPGAYSTNAGNEYLVGWVGDNGNSVTISNSSGYTASSKNINGSGTADLFVAWKPSTGGAESASFPLSGTDDWASALVAFKLAPSGPPDHSGAAALSGSGSLTSAASVNFASAASLSGSGSLTAAGSVNFASAVSLSGSGSLAAAGQVDVPRSASLSGQGSFTAAGAVNFALFSALSGAGSLTAAGSVSFISGAALSGSGSLTAAAVVAFRLAAALSGSGTLTSAAAVNFASAAVLSGSGSLQALASVSFASAAALSGSGSLTAAGSAGFSRASVLTGTGVLSAGASAGFSFSAALSGQGALTASAAVSGGRSGSAALSGQGVLVASDSVSFASSAVLSGVGSLAAAGIAGFFGTAALSGQGSLAAAGTLALAASSALSGQGSLSAAGAAAFFTGTALAGAGSLGAAVVFRATGAAVLSGTGILGAAGIIQAAGAAALSGMGALTARAVFRSPVVRPAGWSAVLLSPRWSASLLAARWNAALLPPRWSAGLLAPRYRSALQTGRWAAALGQSQISSASPYVEVPIGVTPPDGFGSPLGAVIKAAFLTSPPNVRQPSSGDEVTAAWAAPQPPSVPPYEAVVAVGASGSVTLAPGTYYCWIRITPIPEDVWVFCGQLTVQ